MAETKDRREHCITIVFPVDYIIMPASREKGHVLWDEAEDN